MRITVSYCGETETVAVPAGSTVRQVIEAAFWDKALQGNHYFGAGELHPESRLTESGNLVVTPPAAAVSPGPAYRRDTLADRLRKEWVVAHGNPWEEGLRLTGPFATQGEAYDWGRKLEGDWHLVLMEVPE